MHGCDRVCTGCMSVIGCVHVGCMRVMACVHAGCRSVRGCTCMSVIRSEHCMQECDCVCVLGSQV